MSQRMFRRSRRAIARASIHWIAGELLSTGILPGNDPVVEHHHTLRSHQQAIVRFDRVHSGHLEGTAPAASTLPSFNIVTNPNVPNSNLNATSADAPNDIWAVGFSNPTSPIIEQPLAEHFNGTSWSVDSPPALSA